MSQYGSIPRKIHFSITFWGRWHTDALIKSLLPSLLTDGNLPALARDYALEFSFLTTPDDRTSLEASGAYKKLRNLATIEIVENADLIPERRFAIHHKWWRRAIKRARKESAYLGLIPPDICFSDGSMEAIGKRIAGGAACLYISGVRVASETFLPEIIAGFEDGTKNFPSHFDLVHLSLRHSHPFNNSLYLGAPRAPYIAEMMLAPVPGTGWVKNCYLAGPIVFVDPRRTTINAANIVTAIDDPHDFHVIYDSHEVGMVSLAPLNLYAEWSLGCETEDAFTKAFKLRRHYTNISSDIVSRDNFLIYQNQDDRKMPSWIEAEQKINAASLAIQCNLALLDVGDALDRCNFKATSAAIFLTAVTSEAFPEIDMSVPLICAFPRDDQVKRMVKNLDSEGLYNFTFRHIYHHFDLNNGTATNLLGETLHIEKTDGHIMINGVEARCHRTIGRITIYTLAYVGLTRCASKEFKISAERHAYAVIGLGRQRTEIRHVLGQSRIHLRSWLIRRLSPMCYRLLTFAVSELIDLAVKASTRKRKKAPESQFKSALGKSVGDEAIQRCETFLSDHPNEGEAWLHLVNLYLNAGLISKALDTARRGIVCPDPRALYQLGRLTLEVCLAQDAACKHSSTQAIQTPIITLLDDIMAKNDPHDLAHKFFSAICEGGKTLVSNANLLDGLLYEIEGDLAQAEQKFQLALSWHPKAIYPRQGLARVGESRGDRDGAITILLEGIKWQPDDFRSLKNLARLFNSTGNRTAALAMAHRTAIHGRYRPLHAYL